MTPQDAAKILGLNGTVTPEQVKAAYRKAAMRYHPDRNPAGSEMMKLINAAFDVLKDFDGALPDYEQSDDQDYPEAVNEALNAIIGLEGLVIEICGAWVWVSGETYPHRKILKEAFFKYASKKKQWYFRPEGWQSRSRGSLTMDDIREKYGSSKPGFRRRKELETRHA